MIRLGEKIDGAVQQAGNDLAQGWFVQRCRDVGHPSIAVSIHDSPKDPRPLGGRRRSTLRTEPTQNNAHRGR